MLSRGGQKSTMEFEFSEKQLDQWFIWEELSKNATWWSASSISLMLPDQGRGELKEIVVPLSADQIYLIDIASYHTTSALIRFPYNDPQFTEDGRLRVPFKSSEEDNTYKGFEINLSHAFEVDDLIQPIDDPAWSPNSGEWIETKPGFFELADAPTLTTQAESSALVIHCAPNPFKTSSMITYQLRNSSNVTLELFDSAGRKIKVFDQGRKLAGLHQVAFTPEYLPNGLYYCRLSVDNQSKVLTLILQQ